MPKLAAKLKERRYFRGIRRDELNELYFCQLAAGRRNYAAARCPRSQNMPAMMANPSRTIEIGKCSLAPC